MYGPLFCHAVSVDYKFNSIELLWYSVEGGELVQTLQIKINILRKVLSSLGTEELDVFAVKGFVSKNIGEAWR